VPSKRFILERQYSGTIAPRGPHARFQLAEQVRRQLGAGVPGRHSNFDAEVAAAISRVVELTKDNDVIQAFVPPQPNGIVETAHGLIIAGVHIIGLHRGDGFGPIPVVQHAGK
jgi:hypothetical protein